MIEPFAYGGGCALLSSFLLVFKPSACANSGDQIQGTIRVLLFLLTQSVCLWSRTYNVQRKQKPVSQFVIELDHLENTNRKAELRQIRKTQSAARPTFGHGRVCSQILLE